MQHPLVLAMAVNTVLSGCQQTTNFLTLELHFSVIQYQMCTQFGIMSVASISKYLCTLNSKHLFKLLFNFYKKQRSQFFSSQIPGVHSLLSSSSQPEQGSTSLLSEGSQPESIPFLCLSGHANISLWAECHFSLRKFPAN